MSYPDILQRSAAYDAWHLFAVNCLSRGDSDHHQRGPEDDGNRP